mgnify:CR=1 FL=1
MRAASAPLAVAPFVARFALGSTSGEVAIRA